jgi:hypothetical protein
LRVHVCGRLHLRLRLHSLACWCLGGPRRGPTRRSLVSHCDQTLHARLLARHGPRSNLGPSVRGCKRVVNSALDDESLICACRAIGVTVRHLFGDRHQPRRRSVLARLSLQECRCPCVCACVCACVCVCVCVCVCCFEGGCAWQQEQARVFVGQPHHGGS